MTTTSPLPDGEYDLDLSSLFRSGHLSDIFGIRYSFRPDNIDNAFAKELIKISNDSNANDFQDSNSFILKSESKKLSSLTETTTSTSKSSDKDSLNHIFFEGKRNNSGLIHNGSGSIQRVHNNSNNGSNSNNSREINLPSIASSSLNLVANQMQSSSSQLTSSSSQSASEFILIYDEINKNFKLDLFGNNIIKMTKSRTPVESSMKFKRNVKKIKSLSSKEIEEINFNQLLDLKSSLYYDTNKNGRSSSSLPNSSHNSPNLSPRRFVSSPTKTSQIVSNSQLKRNISSTTKSSNSSPLLKSINSPIFRPSSTPTSPISSVLKSIPTMKKASATKSSSTRSKLNKSTTKRPSEDSDIDEIRLTDLLPLKKEATNVPTKKQKKPVTTSKSKTQQVKSNKSSGASSVSPEETNDNDSDSDIMDFANELEQELGHKKIQTKKATKKSTTISKKQPQNSKPTAIDSKSKIKTEEVEVTLKNDDDEWDVNYSDWDEGDFEKTQLTNNKARPKTLLENPPQPLSSEALKNPIIGKLQQTPTLSPKGPISMKELAMGERRVATPTLNGGIYSPSSEAYIPKSTDSALNIGTPDVSKSKSVNKKQESKKETSNEEDKDKNDDNDDVDSFEGAFDEDFNNAFEDYDLDNSDFEDPQSGSTGKGPITVDDDEEMSEEE